MRKLFACLFLLSIFSCKSQNKALQEQIDAQIAEIEDVIKFSNVKISAEPYPEKGLLERIDAFKEKSNYNPSFFGSLKIETTSRFPNSYFLINYDTYELSRVLGYDNFYFGDNPERVPKFEIKEIFYADGTQESALAAILKKNEVLKLSYSDEDDEAEKNQMAESDVYFFQKNSKPITSVEVKVTTNFSNATDFEVDKNKKEIKTNKGTIEVTAFGGNEFTYKYPASLAGKIEVNAIYKNGKYLTSKGNQTFKSSHEIEKLEEVIKTLEVAKSEVASGKINTEKELEKYLQTKVKKTDLNPNANITQSEYFSATISKVVISVLGDDKLVESVHRYSISDFKKDRLTTNGFEICEDMNTKKQGLVDFSGNWLVKPIYRHISQHNFMKNYAQVALNDKEGANTLFWIDKKNKQLVKTNYSISSYTLQKNENPNLLIVQNINKPNTFGVANRETGQLIIPTIYDHISFTKGKIYCQPVDSKTEKIFDATGKQIGVNKIN